jgi:hypothetical protein
METPIGLKDIDLKQASTLITAIKEFHAYQLQPVDQPGFLLRLSTMNQKPIGPLKLTLKVLCSNRPNNPVRLLNTSFSTLAFDQELPITAHALTHSFDLTITPNQLGAVYVECGQAKSNVVVFRGVVL